MAKATLHSFHSLSHLHIYVHKTKDWSKGPKKAISASTNFVAGNPGNTIFFSITDIHLYMWMSYLLTVILFWAVEISLN